MHLWRGAFSGAAGAPRQRTREPANARRALAHAHARPIIPKVAQHPAGIMPLASLILLQLGKPSGEPFAYGSGDTPNGWSCRCGAVLDHHVVVEHEALPILKRCNGFTNSYTILLIIYVTIVMVVIRLGRARGRARRGCCPQVARARRALGIGSALQRGSPKRHNEWPFWSSVICLNIRHAGSGRLGVDSPRFRRSRRMQKFQKVTG